MYYRGKLNVKKCPHKLRGKLPSGCFCLAGLPGGTGRFSPQCPSICEGNVQHRVSQILYNDDTYISVKRQAIPSCRTNGPANASSLQLLQICQAIPLDHVLPHRHKLECHSDFFDRRRTTLTAQTQGRTKRSKANFFDSHWVLAGIRSSRYSDYQTNLRYHFMCVLAFLQVRLPPQQVHERHDAAADTCSTGY